VQVSLKDYISVLETEVETLRKNYYNSQPEGTGHFKTAVSVLEFRIEELKTQL
jgi:hypothetical protein